MINLLKRVCTHFASSSSTLVEYATISKIGFFVRRWKSACFIEGSFASMLSRSRKYTPTCRVWDLACNKHVASHTSNIALDGYIIKIVSYRMTAELNRHWSYCLQLQLSLTKADTVKPDLDECRRIPTARNKIKSFLPHIAEISLSRTKCLRLRCPP